MDLVPSRTAAIFQELRGFRNNALIAAIWLKLELTNAVLGLLRDLGEALVAASDVLEAARLRRRLATGDVSGSHADAILQATQAGVS